MKPEIHWWAPIPLRNGRSEDLIYTVDLAELPTTAGVYVFARPVHDHLVPLYIGKASWIRLRVRSQLNNTRLMVEIQREASRRRVLVVGELIGKPGQAIQKTLGLVENALIEYATLEGHELLNHHGTRPKTHTITFWGSRLSRSWIGRHLTVTESRRRR